MFRMFDGAGISPAIDYLRCLPVVEHFQLPTWILFSIPDASWVLFGTTFTAVIWRFNTSGWLYLFPTLGIGSELLQYYQFVPGVFDLVDLILLCVFSLIPLLIVNFPVSHNVKNTIS